MARAVEIIGGGISGLSLAVALSGRGIPVTVWEAGNLPRHRVCGEFVCGVRKRTLENLGVVDDFGDALVHRRAVWKGLEGRKLFVGNLPQPALGLSRFVLDVRLANRIRANGGEVRIGERWRGDPESEGVVMATGRLAERTEWMGFKLHLSGNLPQDLTLFLGDGGYVGLSPIEGGFWNLCGLFRKRAEVRAGKEEVLGAYAEAAGLKEISGVLSQATIREGSAAGVAGVSFQMRSHPSGEVRLGDAWGVIPPFTGNGMSIAFESAELALAPVERWAKGHGNWAEVVAAVSRAHRKHFRCRFTVANALHPLLLNPRGQGILGALSRSKVLPFRPLFALTH